MSIWRSIHGYLRRALGVAGGAPAGAPDPDPDEAPPDPEAVVVMPIEDAIDLHTFAPRDVPSVVDEYLREARRRGLREVRVIHGKGKGVQRAVVARVLERHPDVASFASAPGTRGGWGATVVVLKPRRP